MIVSAGLAEPCVGITLPSAMNRFGTSHARWSASTTLRSGSDAHPAAADEVGVAVDRQHVLGAGRLEDVVQRLLGERDVLAVVLALRVVHPRHRDPVLVGDVAGATVTRFSGSGSSSDRTPERVPVVVVAHVLAQRRPPVPVAEHVLGVLDRQRPDRLDREPAREPARAVGLVELLGGDLRRRRLVHPHLVGEAAGHLRRALDHHAAPDLVVVVGQAVREAAAGRVQQQPRRLDRVARDRDRVGALEALGAVVQVADAGDAAARLVDLDLASTMQSARISAPCSIASGMWVTSGEALALTLQPCRQ